MAKEEKKPKKKKPGKKAHELYDISGETFKRKNKSCPKCGTGYLLAEHQDRQVCGKCHYVEMKPK